MKIREEDILLVAFAADAIIKAQKDRIKELEEQNKYLQEVLDAACLNKCRVRKVRVLNGKTQKTSSL